MLGPGFVWEGKPGGPFSVKRARSWAGDDEKINLLIVALKDEDPRIVAIAARALAYIGPPRALVPLADAFRRFEGVGDGSLSLGAPPAEQYRHHFGPLARQQCVYALGGVTVRNRQRTLAILQKAVRDADGQVQREALLSLCSDGSPEAARILKEITMLENKTIAEAGVEGRSEAELHLEALQEEFDQAIGGDSVTDNAPADDNP
jgi:HEAT repeat protein